jgi:hypothetical protein
MTGINASSATEEITNATTVSKVNAAISSVVFVAT